MSNENERPMSDKKKKKPKPYKKRKKREAEKQKNATWHSESEKKRNPLDGVLDLLKEKKRSHSILSFPSDPKQLSAPTKSFSWDLKISLERMARVEIEGEKEAEGELSQEEGTPFDSPVSTGAFDENSDEDEENGELDDKDRKISELKNKIQGMKAHMTNLHKINSTTKKLRVKEKAKNRKKKDSSATLPRSTLDADDDLSSFKRSPSQEFFNSYQIGEEIASPDVTRKVSITTSNESALIRNQSDQNLGVSNSNSSHSSPLYVDRRHGHKRSSSDDQIYMNTFRIEDEVNQRDLKGNTKLHWASIFGDVQQACLLIDNGANLDALDAHNMTPLLLAFQQDQHDIVNLLLERGADIWVKDGSDNTPLHLAFLHHFADVAQELVEMADVGLINSKNINGNSPLLLACSNRHVHAARTLVSKGAEVNTKNNFHDTPLLFASAQGYTELVSLLLAKGAEVNVQDIHGNTSLHKAATNGHKEVAEVLVERGANLKLRNDYDRTPLDEAKTPQMRKLLEDYDPSSKSWVIDSQIK